MEILMMLHRQNCLVPEALCAVPRSFRVTSCDHRQLSTGGFDEQRIGRWFEELNHFRQLAIQLRMSGEAIDAICQRLGRPPSWFHKWWSRYRLEGAEGLYDLSRAPHSFLDRLSPQIERLIVSVRRRLEAHASPETRCQRIGAPTIQTELKGLQVVPLPSLRTIERVLSHMV